TKVDVNAALEEVPQHEHETTEQADADTVKNLSEVHVGHRFSDGRADPLEEISHSRSHRLEELPHGTEDRPHTLPQSSESIYCSVQRLDTGPETVEGLRSTIRVDALAKNLLDPASKVPEEVDRRGENAAETLEEVTEPLTVLDGVPDTDQEVTHTARELQATARASHEGADEIKYNPGEALDDRPPDIEHGKLATEGPLDVLGRRLTDLESFSEVSDGNGDVVELLTRSWRENIP